MHGQNPFLVYAFPFSDLQFEYTELKHLFVHFNAPTVICVIIICVV